MLKNTTNVMLGPLIIIITLSSATKAQLDEKRFEVGGVFTSITLSDFTAFPSPTGPIQNNIVRGLGGRFGYNFNDCLAVDAEGSFFPESHFWNDGVGQKLQGFGEGRCT